MPKFFNANDLSFIKTIAEEVIDYVSEQSIVLFKVSVGESKTNLYGESIGKVYHAPTILMARVERDATTTDYDGFGGDKRSVAKFSFNKERLRPSSYNIPRIRDISGSLVPASAIQNEQYGYPEIGDIILFNDTYFEIDNIESQKLVGGSPQTYDKVSGSFEDSQAYLVCSAVSVRRSQVQIEERTR